MAIFGKKSDHKHDKSGLVCNHVIRGKRPLRMIAQDENGVWQFMCGKDDHSKAKQAKPVCVVCMFDKVKSIARDAVPAGHIAERSGEGWQVREMNADEIGQISDTDTSAKYPGTTKTGVDNTGKANKIA